MSARFWLLWTDKPYLMSETDAKMTDEPLRDSERMILSLVHRKSPIARSDITKHVPLSQQAVHRLIDGLENRGFLRLLPAKIHGRGKPSPQVELSPDTYISLGVSFTTEEVLICLLGLNGELLVQQALDAPPNEPEAMLAKLEQKLTGWSENEFQTRKLIGIGIAMQGLRNGDADRFEPPALLSNWRNLPLESLFQERFGLPSFAENNATASATAEYFLGGGADHDCFAYLSINFGFGSGIFWQRKPIQGGHGNAGEISTIYSREAADHRPALGELLKRMQAAGIDLNDIAALTNKYTPEHPVVMKWLEEITPYLQQSLAAIKGVVDPTAIFFGGETSAAMRQALIKAGTGADLRSGPDPILRESSIDGDSAHLGAAFLPLHSLVFSE